MEIRWYLPISYVWLIDYKSDLKIAKDTGLLSTEMIWNFWTAFVRLLLHPIDATPGHRCLHGSNQWRSLLESERSHEYQTVEECDVFQIPKIVGGRDLLVIASKSSVQ
jgi:hypothetical protein